MNTSVKSKYPVAIFELIPASQNGANFVREDTIGTQNPIVLIHPKNRVIQNESVVKMKNVKGDAFVNVPTRYIYNQDIILKKEQETNNIQPNPRTDKINFINGLITVPKNGAFVGLYEFLKQHAQNLTNPERIESLQPIFRELKPAEDAHEANFNEFLSTEAIGYIKEMVTVNKDKTYSYNEDRIDAICPLFGVVADSYEQKVTALIQVAKADPQTFLVKAKTVEQTMEIEVSHGIKLGVIAFEGNTALYVGKNLKIKTWPGRLAEEKKNQVLAQYFSSSDGKEAYELYKAELAAAKAESIKNN